MKSASVFTDILQDINATNAREKLATLNARYPTSQLRLFNNVADVVYMQESNLLLVGQDFLSPSESKDWLADEEGLNGEPPLYFSTESHRFSPVYHLKRAKAFFSRFFPQPPYHINILLICNYNIINYEDMQSIWKDMGVIVVHQMTDTPPILPEKEKKLPTNFQKDSDLLSDEEFEHLLDEFIKQENTESNSSTDDTTSKDTTSFQATERKIAIPLPEIPEECFQVKELKLFNITSISDEKDFPKCTQLPLKVFNVNHLKTIGVNSIIDCQYSQKPTGNFFFNLYNEIGQQLIHQKAACVFSTIGHTLQAFIHVLLEKKGTTTWEKGKYLLELKFEDETLTTILFKIGNQNIEGSFPEAQQTTGSMCERPFEILERMTGLKQVKEQMSRYRNTILFAQKRKAKGLQTEMPLLHAVFMGNPGTGKTTVARLYGAMLKELGLLSRGHVVFRERSSLMGQNYSSEQEKTLEALKEAQGGILFIDEAHSLYKPEDIKDPGRNVLDTLLTAMNDRDWALLLAGYTSEMPGLLTLNEGLGSRIPLQNRYYFEDYTPDELLKIADTYCETHNYILTTEARKALRNKIVHDYARKDRSFGNGRYIIELLSNEILQAMSLRVAQIKRPTLLQLITIEKEDIPQLALKNYKKPLKALHDMVGLSHLKQNIESHLNMVRMFMLRNEQGIHTDLPPLHMVFTGNPGTGKTTVADLIGEIYASLGLLSIGNVIRVERKDLVGTYIGDTERKTVEVLKRAQGNVLFIDEAYSLCCDASNKKDYGHRVLEVLLTTLEQDHTDMLVILAGYPDEMEQLFQANPGLRSRIPYTFHFEDYKTEELISIAKGVAAKMDYKFTPAALKALRELIEERMKHRDANWGNARFVTRLITNTIIPAMSSRLLALPPHKLKDKKTLLTICRADIPSTDIKTLGADANKFDESAIQHALQKLDKMVGLEQVKQNIHNLVSVARHLHLTGRSYTECCSLRWNFTGHTGTGKSSIAGIIGELLKAMHILEKGHLTEVKAEEFYNVSEHKADEILRRAINRSRQGILFIDGDAPTFNRPSSSLSNENLRFKLSSIIAETPDTYALIIATNESRTPSLAQDLRKAGQQDFDHTFFFKDYTAKELYQILEQCLKKQKLQLSEKAAGHIIQYIQGLCSRRELGYANARTMELISNSIAETCWCRISVEGNKCNHKVIWEDVQHFIWDNNRPQTHIGYK